MISGLFFRVPGPAEGAFRGGQGSAGGAGGAPAAARGRAGEAREPAGAGPPAPGPVRRVRAAREPVTPGENEARGAGVRPEAAFPAGPQETGSRPRGNRGEDRGAPRGWRFTGRGAGWPAGSAGAAGAGGRHAAAPPAPVRGRMSSRSREAPGEARPTAGPGAPLPGRGPGIGGGSVPGAERDESTDALGPGPDRDPGVVRQAPPGGVAPGAGDGVAAGPVRNPESRERRAPRASGRFADSGREGAGGLAGRPPEGSGAEQGLRRVRCGGGDRSPRSVPGRPRGGRALDLPAGAGVAAEAAVFAPALRQPGGSGRRLCGVPAGQVGARGTGVSGGPARAGSARRRGGRSLPGRRPRPATGGRGTRPGRVPLRSESAGARRRGRRGPGSAGCRGRVAEGRRPQPRGRRARR